MSECKETNQTRPNGLYWVFCNEQWTIAKYQSDRHFPNLVWSMIGDDVTREEHEIDVVGEMVKPSTKSITTINGSKYNFTEQGGGRLVSYGFDTHEELVTHIRGLRKQRGPS